jgi:hypothetical protein
VVEPALNEAPPGLIRGRRAPAGVWSHGDGPPGPRSPGPPGPPGPPCPSGGGPCSWPPGPPGPPWGGPPGPPGPWQSPNTHGWGPGCAAATPTPAVNADAPTASAIADAQVKHLICMISLPSRLTRTPESNFRLPQAMQPSCAPALPRLGARLAPVNRPINHADVGVTTRPTRGDQRKFSLSAARRGRPAVATPNHSMRRPPAGSSKTLDMQAFPAQCGK